MTLAVINNPATIRHNDVDVESDPRWHVAQRATRSVGLRRAAQLQAILLYVVRHAILDPEEPLREYEIACAVLGRRSDFNPIDDNIVRVQIGHLRKKLEQYFATEGSGEPIVITLERGSYNPVFRPKSESAILASEPTHYLDRAAEASGAATPLARAPLSVAPDGFARRWYMVAAAVGVALVLGWVAGRVSRPTGHGDKDASSNISNPILRRIFAPNALVNIVVADTSLVFMQNTIHSNISISQYLDTNYPANILGQLQNPEQKAILTDISSHRYTSLDDADVVGDCFKWGSVLGAKTVIRYARDLHVRDFEQGSYIVIGSRRGNPWASLRDKDVNFVFEEFGPNHNFHFRNRNPQPGEEPTYEFTVQPDGQSIGYVDIVVLPNLAHTGNILLLNGFSMETNEAAANLIFQKDLRPDLSAAINNLGPNSKIEILLRVHNLDHSQNGSEVVATRMDQEESTR